MRFYLSNFKLKFITELQYKASAIAGILTQVFFGIIFIMVYLAFYESGSKNAPITIEQTVSYLWLNQAFFSLIFLFYRDKDICQLIKNGTLSYELIRPKNLYFMWIAKILGKRYSMVLIRMLPVLIISVILPKPYCLVIASPINILLFILALIIGSFVMAGIVNFTNVLMLVTLDDKGISNILRAIADILSGGCIPIAFFPSLLKKIALFLPFSYVSDFPFRIYTSQVVGIEILKGFLIQIIWIIILVILGNIILKRVIKRVEVQGG